MIGSIPVWSGRIISQRHSYRQWLRVYYCVFIAAEKRGFLRWNGCLSPRPAGPSGLKHENSRPNGRLRRCNAVPPTAVEGRVCRTFGVSTAGTLAQPSPRRRHGVASFGSVRTRNTKRFASRNHTKTPHGAKPRHMRRDVKTKRRPSVCSAIISGAKQQPKGTP